MTPALLRCENLRVRYASGLVAVDGADFSIAPGECLALVGESGSGKTTIARAILGLLPADAEVSGVLRLGPTDLLNLGEAGFRQLRGRQIGYVAQDPYQACDPLRTVGDHVGDAWRALGTRAEPRTVADRLTQAGIEAAGRTMLDHPHRWSGGMLQRASIAAAGAHKPPLLVADEPTSALDADRADAIIGTIRATGAAVLLVCHDLPLVRRHADRVVVCKDGRIVETGSCAEIFDRPQHPYTKILVNAAAAVTAPRMRAPATGGQVFFATDLRRTYRQPDHEHCAVDGVDLALRRGEIVGITGPSGCGKSTLLRLVAGLEQPCSGSVERFGVGPGSVMPVFQDPVAGLDRRWPVWRSLTEPLTARGRLESAERKVAARAALQRLGLGEIDIEALPGELSSGQCQRISVARALIGAPLLLVADEPTSALDTRATAQVMAMIELAAAQGAGVLLVSHDRALLTAYCHRVIEMRDGRFVPPADMAAPVTAAA
jgi:peptide/nickel transport system ATP-binding protein